MRKAIFTTAVLCLALSFSCTKSSKESIPLPEHPRPDFQRAEWINLNGYWDFTFDEAVADSCMAASATQGMDKKILVPFPWGSPLSEVENEGDVAWYSREISVPVEWAGKRVFLVVGASDFETSCIFEGEELGTHRGGYTPFEFELTDLVKFGLPQRVFIKADDTKDDTHLYGKQGYGDARGIWQTVYLEARGSNYIRSIHFSPDIDASYVRVAVNLAEPAANGEVFSLKFKDGSQEEFIADMSGHDKASFIVQIKDQHLWSLDDPYLYEVTATLRSGEEVSDEVDTYFGQRKISIMPFPGADFNYIALNNKPIYLQLCLDQSYHPEGYYTFPSDEFMREEIMISKRLGLNGNRIHIKVEVPRKLYWADKLGLLIMADTPNFWGEPVPEARGNWEECLRAQVDRDYNHPSIFAWVNFNETWGLMTGGKYRPETQDWVRAMYHLTKRLDPTRLVEDNSACNFDHVQTDINSWHAYKRGRLWEPTLEEADQKTFKESGWNYIGGNMQMGEPMMNSECGNVWGYNGSAGDCDYTWDYHIMINSFRRHPKCCGWLYTEHHDVINEWNGYVKYDRSAKIDGLDYLMPGMTIADFQSLYYIAPECYLITYPKGGEDVTIPFYASFMTDNDPGALKVETELVGWNQLGEFAKFSGSSQSIDFEPYMSRTAGSFSFTMPQEKGLYILRITLKNEKQEVLHRNFTCLRVNEGKDVVKEDEVLVPFAPASFTAQQWSDKQTAVYDGLKENGFGHGYFEYEVVLPEGSDLSKLSSARLVFEASAKEWFGKDREGNEIAGDYMLGKGTFDHCKSLNSYAMTDNVLWPSKLEVTVNGKKVATLDLKDDPADHRGILSWASQTPERWMREAGSYGYLFDVEVPVSALVKDAPQIIRFTVPESEPQGGLALYGKDFGRYPLDPTLILKY